MVNQFHWPAGTRIPRPSSRVVRPHSSLEIGRPTGVKRAVRTFNDVAIKGHAILRLLNVSLVWAQLNIPPDHVHLLLLFVAVYDPVAEKSLQDLFAQLREFQRVAALFQPFSCASIV